MKPPESATRWCGPTLAFRRWLHVAAIPWHHGVVLARKSRRTFSVLLLASGCFYGVPGLAPQDGVVMAGAAGQPFSGEGGGGQPSAVEEPTALAVGFKGLRGLAQDEDDLYFTAADGVHRCAKSGEPDWLLKVADGFNLGQLVVDDAWVYFVDAEQARIAKVEKRGGYAQTVVVTEGPFSLASDDSSLFYGSSAGGVFRVGKDGSGVAQIYRGPAGSPQSIHSLVVVGSEIIFGHSSARGVFAVPKDGTANARQLTQVTQSVFGLAASGSTVYFREGNSTEGVLSSVPLLGGVRTDLLLDEPGPAGATGDQDYVFFTTQVQDIASVKEYQITSATQRSLAQGRTSADAVQFDPTSIYWTEPAAGQVLKLSR